VSAGRVVVIDPYLDEGWIDELRAGWDPGAYELLVPTEPAVADEEMRTADVVVVTGRRRLDAEALAGLTRTRGIVCLSTGTDQVDVAAAEAAGIRVANVPDYCSVDVADHAMTLLLAAQRRLPPLAAAARRGDWDVFNSADVDAIRRLEGQTLGVLGAGRIGRLVCRRAQAFGFETIAHDPFDVDPEGLYEPVSVDELAARSDALVLCAALTSDSRHVIGESFLRGVRPGLILVNVARGGLVDEAALVQALDDGRVSVAALDVRETEPPGVDDPLASRDDVIVTTHLAGMSDRAFDDLVAKAGATILEMLR